MDNKTRFMQLYEQIKNPNNGYFSPEGIPYHSVETLICEAPDYGHMTTSEAYSYWASSGSFPAGYCPVSAEGYRSG